MPVTCTVAIRTRPARRGAAYALVLVTAMLLTMLALAGVAVRRVQGRMSGDGSDWTEAQMLAFSGVEHATARIGADPDWRTTFSGQTVQQSLGRGTFSWRLVDEADGNLADDTGQDFAVVSTGVVGNARFSLHVNMTPPSAGLRYGVCTPTTITLSSGAYVDSYDSTLGSYGGGNRGSAATIATNATAAAAVSLGNNCEIRGSVKVGVGGNPGVVISNSDNVTGAKTALTQPVTMPTVTAPTGLGGSSGALATGNNQTLAVSTDRHVDSLLLANGSTLEISGNVTMLVEGSVTISRNAQIHVLPGASLKLYFRGSLTVQNNADGMVVDGQNLSRLQLLGLGNGDVSITNADIQGVLIAPNSDITLSSGASVCGAVVGKSVTMSSNARIHQDRRITSGTDLVNVGASGASKPRATAWRQAVN